MAHTPGTAVIPVAPSAATRRRSRAGRSGPSRVVIDDVSKLIIEQLQQDGRRSYAAIGKAVGLSEAAVRQRVQRLIDGGVMQIVAVTDPMTLGFHRQTMIGIKCEGDLERDADHLAHIDDIDYIVITPDCYDIILEVFAEEDCLLPAYRR